MSITLRRKMFKLGGETNTHGIGITSGLEYRRPGYNAGGPVEPQATFGVGNNANKMIGPDGKVREANYNFFPLLMPGVTTLGKIASRGSKGGLEALKRFFRPKTGRGPGGERVVPGASIRTTTPRGTTIRSKTIKTPGDRLPPGFKDYFKMAPRYLGAGVGGAGILGGASALLPQFDDSPDDTLGEDILDTGRTVSEGAFDLMTGLPSSILQAPFRKAEDIQRPSNIIKEALYGPAEKVGSDNDTAGGLNQKDISPAMETALTQDEQFAKMKADADARAEMYYAMLGGDGPNKVRALSDAFTAAGALYDEDKSQALAGFSQGITGELDRDAAVRDEARRLGLQEVVGLRDEERMDTKSRAQMVEQAKLAIMTSADYTPEQRQSTLRQLEAFELGIADVLPTNDKGDEIDTGTMSPGSIYIDINGITDGKYVAVSNDSNDPNQVDSFNNISEAEAHARS